MRSCPNCGGGLVFDIPSQGLKCPSCSSNFPIGEVPETRAAKADGTMDAMIFTCPQCGGEVWSTSETAAGFCSFCGASVQLEGRMVSEKMPDHIIPFKIDKKECSRKFKEHVGSYYFAPSDLKNDSAKLEFRGIYMPYWSYNVHQQAQVHRAYEDEHRSGDYRVIEHYNFDWDLNEDIPDIQHDASSSFDDELGLAISPFDPKQSVPFDSSYMEGFYGDVADTAPGDYEEFALNEAVKYTEKVIDSKTQSERTDNGPVGNDEFGGKVTKSGLSLFPVWFLSYRSGSRIAYSVVNGQNGKVYVDLPVSIPKYLGTVAVMTAVLFVVLSFFMTPTPQLDVGFAALMTIISSVTFRSLSRQILEKDGILTVDEKKDKTEKKKGTLLGIIRGFGVGSFILAFWVINMMGDFLDALGGMSIIYIVLSVVAVIVSIGGFMYFMQRAGDLARCKGGGVFPSPLMALLSAVLGLAVLVVNPVSDLWYYGITTLSMTAAAISLVSLLSLRSMLSTRRLPEFDTHKGGDHRAK